MGAITSINGLWIAIALLFLITAAISYMVAIKGEPSFAVTYFDLIGTTVLILAGVGFLGLVAAGSKSSFVLSLHSILMYLIAAGVLYVAIGAQMYKTKTTDRFFFFGGGPHDGLPPDQPYLWNWTHFLVYCPPGISFLVSAWLSSRMSLCLLEEHRICEQTALKAVFPVLDRAASIPDQINGLNTCRIWDSHIAPHVNLDDLMDLLRIVRYWQRWRLEERLDGMQCLQNVCVAALLHCDKDEVLEHPHMDKDTKLHSEMKVFFIDYAKSAGQGERFLPGNRHLELWVEVFRIVSSLPTADTANAESVSPSHGHSHKREVKLGDLSGPCKKASRIQVLAALESEQEDAPENESDVLDELDRFQTLTADI